MTHCIAPASRRHNIHQFAPGVTEASTAPLALNGCGSGRSGDPVHPAAHRLAHAQDQPTRAAAPAPTATERNCHPEKPPAPSG